MGEIPDFEDLDKELYLQFVGQYKQLQQRIEELEIRISEQEEEIDGILTDISGLEKRIYGEDDGDEELNFESDGDWEL